MSAIIGTDSQPHPPLRQVTSTCLLGIAVQIRATLDKRLVSNAVIDGVDHLYVTP